MSLRGATLLFGLGTKALPVWDSRNEAEQSYWRPYRQTNGRSKRTHDLTSSIVPRGTSFHRSVEFRFSPIVIDLRWLYAATTSLVQRNSVPSTHMRCMMTVVGAKGTWLRYRTAHQRCRSVTSAECGAMIGDCGDHLEIVCWLQCGFPGSLSSETGSEIVQWTPSGSMANVVCASN